MARKNLAAQIATEEWFLDAVAIKPLHRIHQETGEKYAYATLQRAAAFVEANGKPVHKRGQGSSIKAPGGEDAQTQVEFKENADGTAVFSGKSYNIRTFEELAAYAEIDLDIWEEVWREANKWEVGAKDKNKDLQVHQLFQVKAKYQKRKGVEQARAIISDMVKAAERFAPKYPKIKHVRVRDPHMAIFGLPDPHIGKLCWAAETGTDYDIKIARKMYQAAIEDLAAKSQGFPIERIILPIGNDFYNSDGISNATTKGTQQDTDGRWQKLFQVGREVCVEAIDYLTNIAPVEVVCVPGNHDHQTSIYLAQVLHAWYRNCPNVKVDIEPGTRKYVHYEKNLIGMAHGDKENKKKLPLLMMTEMRRIWGQCSYGEWLTGHIHTRSETEYKTADEDCGIRHQTMSALSGTDAYHHQHGYRNMRAAEAFLYSPNFGRVATFSHFPADQP